MARCFTRFRFAAFRFRQRPGRWVAGRRSRWNKVVTLRAVDDLSIDQPNVDSGGITGPANDAQAGLQGLSAAAMAGASANS